MALDNLLVNAVRHGGGQVTLRITAAADAASIEVEDNGPGVPDELKAQVFKRFERGNASAPGSGLGLALVHQQAELHGGSAYVEDVNQHGARFV